MKGWVVVFFLLLALVGWGMNLGKAVWECDYSAESSYKCEVVRVGGVLLPPLGAVVGWVDLGE